MVQAIRSDVVVKISLAGPHEKPICKEVATNDYASLLNEAKQLADA